MIEPHDGVKGGRVLGLSKRLYEIVSLRLRESIPRLDIGFLTLDAVDLGETGKRFFEVEGRVAHEHVGETDELVKIVTVVSGDYTIDSLSCLNKGLTM